MMDAMVIQGRKLVQRDFELIKELMATHPDWGRKRLSVELCERWNWRTTNNRLKDMACRTLLLKLERKGLITLPPRQGPSTNASRNQHPPLIEHRTDEIVCDLKSVLPLKVTALNSQDSNHTLFRCLVARYHYLGLKNTVGENMKYLVHTCEGREIACLLFGSAAWKSAPRDVFIEWDPTTCVSKLGLITNNTRFLILPWVKIPHLASHLLSRIAQRVSSDWESKYGHSIVLMETFVDRSRFKGTCYRAANWIYVGKTDGRSRNDRKHTLKVPQKDIYLYPLSKKFRSALRS
jgi:hypothetical protein